MKTSVGIVGMGVVGSGTAYQLYSLGNEIVGSDVRLPSQINGWLPEYNYRKKYSIKETDATFMCLPTPSTEDKLYAGMNWSERAKIQEGRFSEGLDQKLYEGMAQQLGEELRQLDDYHLFVMRSTVEPGTTRDFGKRLQQISGKELGREFGVSMVPEFLRAYNSEQDAVEAKLVVAGYMDEQGLETLQDIYQNIQKGELYPVSLEEAELIKLESNAINAMWISFNNARLENYELIENRKGFSIDYDKMTDILTTMTETYTNPKYGSSAGLFYGGTCLRKDPTALLTWLEDRNQIYSYFSRFIELGVRMNLSLQKRILNDHNFPKTIVNGIPERLKSRDHETYDNIRKIEHALGQGDFIIEEKRTSQVA